MINKEVNMRTTLTIPKDLKAQLEILAQEDRRSVNNLIINVLDKYVQTELNSMHNKME
jgi:predicted HicB family RNase H-like nuclease